MSATASKQTTKQLVSSLSTTIQSNPIQSIEKCHLVCMFIHSFIHIRSIINHHHHHRDIVLLLPINNKNKNKNKSENDRDDHELVASRDDALLLV